MLMGSCNLVRTEERISADYTDFGEHPPSSRVTETGGARLLYNPLVLAERLGCPKDLGCLQQNAAEPLVCSGITPQAWHIRETARHVWRPNITFVIETRLALVAFFGPSRSLAPPATGPATTRIRNLCNLRIFTSSEAERKLRSQFQS